MFFRDIIGQQKTKDTAYSVGKRRAHVPHAQLFAGMEGTGALQLALAYTRYIHCTNRGSGRFLRRMSFLPQVQQIHSSGYPLRFSHL